MYDKDKHTNILSLCLSHYSFCLGVFGWEWHAEMKAADATVAGLDASSFCAAQTLPPPQLYYFLRTLKFERRFEKTYFH